MRVMTVCCLLVCVGFFGCKARVKPLSAEQQVVWDRFLEKHLSSGMVMPNSGDATAVAAIGDAIVPYVEENLGKAYRGPGGKSDYWLLIVLGRIGSPKAVDVICKALEHDYPGALGRDRETAAKALVWLGAKHKAPVLKAAIEDHEKRIKERLAEKTGGQRQVEKLGYEEELNTLRRRLKMLEEGKGKRDMTNFPFDRM